MNKILAKLIVETNRALKEKEVPIACVLAVEGEIISFSHNKRIALSDPTAHAEILCIRKAAKKLNTWNLSNCELFVTLKPCKMCQEVIKESRIKKVFYIIDSDKKVNDNVDYIDLFKIEDYFNYKEKIVSFFKDKR